MEYRFYGWRDATSAAISDEFKGIATPQDLYDALTHVWCEYTCAPRLRKDWSEDNITLGQCSITAFLVQDIFGGSEQFDDEILDYSDNPEQFREVHFAKEEKRLRYEYLKDELRKYLNG